MPNTEAFKTEEGILSCYPDINRILLATAFMRPQNGLLNDNLEHGKTIYRLGPTSHDDNDKKRLPRDTSIVINKHVSRRTALHAYYIIGYLAAVKKRKPALS